MELSDKIIKEVLAQDENREISTPPWSDISRTVKTQNFFSFGLLHFNIYTLSILIALLGTIGYFGSTLYSDKNIEKEIIPIIQKNKTVSIDTIPTEESIISRQQPFQETTESSKKSKAPVSPFGEKRLEKLQLPEKQPGEKAIINNTILIDSSKKESPTPIKEAVKGKTIYVFETDTVIEVDTVVVNKKIKNR